MCSRSAIFIALVLFVISFCDSTSSECTQLGSCMCVLPDGYYYNLIGLANEKPLNDTKSNMTVIFYPCINKKIKMANDTKTCGSQNGVSLCLYNETSSHVQNLGTVEETQMIMSSNNTFPIFKIHHANVTSFINIKCADKTNFTIDTINSIESHFSLSSPYGCKIKSLSTGSVLVILFFIFIGIYFIGGAIVLKTLRGATGWEMLPNYEFWSELPSLVRDGIVFTFNCCRADSYERI